MLPPYIQILVQSPEGNEDYKAIFTLCRSFEPILNGSKYPTGSAEEYEQYQAMLEQLTMAIQQLPAEESPEKQFFLDWYEQLSKARVPS
jgi:hypothetical protein